MVLVRKFVTIVDRCLQGYALRPRTLGKSVTDCSCLADGSLILEHTMQVLSRLAERYIRALSDTFDMCRPDRLLYVDYHGGNSPEEEQVANERFSMATRSKMIWKIAKVCDRAVLFFFYSQ